MHPYIDTTKFYVDLSYFFNLKILRCKNAINLIDDIKKLLKTDTQLEQALVIIEKLNTEIKNIDYKTVRMTMINSSKSFYHYEKLFEFLNLYAEIKKSQEEINNILSINFAKTN